MPTPPLYNSIAGPDLDVIQLIDPDRIGFYVNSVADQINAFRMNQKHPKRVIDLANWIADIIIETSAQGGSLLEVDVIDPAWTLFQRDANGVCFIDADDTGYLWPPVEVTFPPDVSDATWRLCQVRPTTDLTAANVILVFEDKIVSELREHFGAQVSYPDQTRAEFIQSLVRQANQEPAYPGDVDIRFVPLLPKETFTVADLTMQERIPASATQKYAPPSRANPNKLPAQPTSTQPSAPTLTQLLAAGPGPNLTATDISIGAGMEAFTGALGRGFVPVTPAPPQATLPGHQ